MDYINGMSVFGQYYESIQYFRNEQHIHISSIIFFYYFVYNYGHIQEYVCCHLYVFGGKIGENDALLFFGVLEDFMEESLVS